MLGYQNQAYGPPRCTEPCLRSKYGISEIVGGSNFLASKIDLHGSKTCGIGNYHLFSEGYPPQLNYAWRDYRLPIGQGDFGPGRVGREFQLVCTPLGAEHEQSHKDSAMHGRTHRSAAMLLIFMISLSSC